MKYSTTELKDLITDVVAVPMGKKTRIDIILSTGERLTIMKGSVRKPVMVQLYSTTVNGNAEMGTEAAYFTFAKSIDSYDRERHLKGFAVNYNPARHTV